MAETYEWRHYADGDTPGAWIPTTFLNDGSTFDHTTSAGGITPALAIGDWTTLDDDPFIHIMEARLFGDPALSIGGATFCMMTFVNLAHTATYAASYSVYGIPFGEVDEVLLSTVTYPVSGIQSDRTIDLGDAVYTQLRVIFSLEKIDFGVAIESMSFTDFRYTLPDIPASVEVCPVMWRKRTRGAPISDEWSPYFCTDTLQDFALGDQSTAANGTAAADISYAFTAPDDVYIDVEALMIIDPVANMQDISFTTQTAWSLVGTAIPDGTYVLDIRVDGLWITIGEGSLTMNTPATLHFPVDPLLFVERVRLTVTTHGNVV